jgi:hypothetical protein
MLIGQNIAMMTMILKKSKIILLRNLTEGWEEEGHEFTGKNARIASPMYFNTYPPYAAMIRDIS